MRWTWDAAKERANRRKHRLSFQTAQRVFDDPLAVTIQDVFSREERAITIGMVEGVAVLVVHSWPQMSGGEEVGRIISARRATKHERTRYEEGDF